MVGLVTGRAAEAVVFVIGEEAIYVVVTASVGKL